MTFALVILLLAKTSVVLLSALAAAALLGRSAASMRHRLWSVTFVLVLAVPALALILPAVNLPLPAIATRASTLEALPLLGGPWGFSSSSSSSSVSPNVESAVFSKSTAPEVKLEKAFPHGSPRSGSVSKVDALVTIWAIGVFAALAILGQSLVRVRRLSKDGDVMNDDAWRSAAMDISARFGLSPAPRLVVSDRVASPMAGGVLQPTVFLPTVARQWDAERRDVVLTHEIAHLASRDPLRHLVARVAVACYWFHPLAWMAAHRATVSREQACDEAVLAAGTRPSAYARVLLELAESLGAGASPMTALPMAQRSNLEKRLMTILNSNQRPSSNRVSAIAALGLALVTIAAAAVRPSAAVIDTPSALPAAQAITRGSATMPDTGAATVMPGEAAMAGDAVTQSNDESLAARCRWRGDYSSIGRSGNSMSLQQTFDGVRVCMAADEPRDRSLIPSQLIEQSSHVIMSSERDGQVQQLEVTRSGGNARTVWQVNGKERAADASFNAWRDSMLAVLDATWESSQIRGEESTLRGEISSIHGEESSLRGEISSVRGEVSSMQGEISSVRGRESSLRGEISSIQGELSSMRGEISSEEGAISSLNGRRWDMSSDERKRMDAMVDGHRRKIKEIEKDIEAYNADRKVREVEKEIDAFNADQQVREIQKRIEAFAAERKVIEVQKDIESLKVSDKVRDIQKAIEALNADARVRVAEDRQADALKRLRTAIAAIR